MEGATSWIEAAGRWPRWVWALLVLAALGLWLARAYNRLQALQNRVANAFGQIDVQLKRRHDLIPNLVEVARRYLRHEHDTLQAVIEARGRAQQAERRAAAAPVDAAALGALAGAEAALGGALGRLFALAEDYPELKADQTLRELREELAHTENRIAFARQAYNDEVLAYNDTARHFPTFVAARLFGFAVLPPLQATGSEEERQPPRVRL